LDYKLEELSRFFKGAAIDPVFAGVLLEKAPENTDHAVDQ